MVGEAVKGGVKVRQLEQPIAGEEGQKEQLAIEEEMTRGSLVGSKLARVSSGSGCIGTRT